MMTRVQAEAMTRQGAENNALSVLNHNGFTTFIIKDLNSAGEDLNALTFWCLMKIDYITYPDYVNNIEGLEAYIQYVKKQQENKLLSFDDLNSVKDYEDYRKKIDFIYNIMPQLFASQSIFSDQPSKGYKFKFFTRLYKNIEDAETVKKWRDKIEDLYQEMMKDGEKLYKALVYEFFNHETPIDWDGWEPALNALGLSEKTLTPEQFKIAQKAYNYVLHNATW